MHKVFIFSLKKEDWRYVTLNLLNKLLIYYKNLKKWRQSWIVCRSIKLKKWSILTKLTYFSLSQPAEKNDTKYDLYFTKTKKDEFFGQGRPSWIWSGWKP